MPAVALTTSSPNAAASAKLPSLASGPHLLGPRDGLLVAGGARAHAHLVAVLDEGLREGPADGAGAEDADVHPPRGYRVGDPLR